jgi:hypothetical protein
MTFETMDWEAEAKRVARAFGLLTCTVASELHQGGVCYRANDTTNEFNVSCKYTSRYQCFELERVDKNIIGLNSSTIYLNWEGSVRTAHPDAQTTPELAKGLFHLDLLTPEVEAALQVSISNHQKIEWALEYEENLK